MDTTMIYAQAHDQSVSDDYYKAMTCIENRLDLSADNDVSNDSRIITSAEHVKILDVADDLMKPQFEFETRLYLVGQISSTLHNITLV
jgi:hypothetical protein